ncbi:basic proline-rich protein-like [Ananas comosus]|uniref:Basic proline-rich protein-like n=1 Tax=Ananas comosus TaxID=4615 RepID=A0A6P5GF13_ANACO|nr:basic proline-rich protein-like [Ananas comosus]
MLSRGPPLLAHVPVAPRFPLLEHLAQVPAPLPAVEGGARGVGWPPQQQEPLERVRAPLRGHRQEQLVHVLGQLGPRELRALGQQQQQPPPPPPRERQLLGALLEAAVPGLEEREVPPQQVPGLALDPPRHQPGRRLGALLLRGRAPPLLPLLAAARPARPRLARPRPGPRRPLQLPPLVRPHPPLLLLLRRRPLLAPPLGDPPRGARLEPPLSPRLEGAQQGPEHLELPLG